MPHPQPGTIYDAPNEPGGDPERVASVFARDLQKAVARARAERTVYGTDGAPDEVLASAFDAAARTLGIAVYRQQATLTPSLPFRKYVGPYSAELGGIVPLPPTAEAKLACLADDVKNWLAGLARAGVQRLAIRPDHPKLLQNERGDSVWIAAVSGGPEIDQRELHEGETIPFAKPAQTEQPEAPLWSVTCDNCKHTTVVPLGTLDPKQGACAHVFLKDVQFGALVCMCGLRISEETLAAAGFFGPVAIYEGRYSAGANELADKLTTMQDDNSRLTADVAQGQEARPALMSVTSLPKAYPFAEAVPARKVAKCSTCIYVGDDKEHCENQLYRDAMGTKMLGGPSGPPPKGEPNADGWCCMAWSREDRGNWAKETD